MTSVTSEMSVGRLVGPSVAKSASASSKGAQSFWRRVNDNIFLSVYRDSCSSIFATVIDLCAFEDPGRSLQPSQKGSQSLPCELAKFAFALNKLIQIKLL